MVYYYVVQEQLCMGGDAGADCRFAMVENQIVNCKTNPNMKWVGRLDVD